MQICELDNSKAGTDDYLEASRARAEVVSSPFFIPGVSDIAYGASDADQSVFRIMGVHPQADVAFQVAMSPAKSASLTWSEAQLVSLLNPRLDLSS
jgi:hypothetical protein